MYFRVFLLILVLFLWIIKMEISCVVNAGTPTAYLVANWWMFEWPTVCWAEMPGMANKNR